MLWFNIVRYTKRQMIQGIVDIADKSIQQEFVETQNIVEDETSTSNSNSSSSPVRIGKRKSPIGHSYNVRTPSSANMILKQRNSLTITNSPSSSPCNSGASNSNSPSPYYTPEQSVKQPRRRKQLLNSLLSDHEDDSSKSSMENLLKLPPCNDIKEGIRQLNDEQTTSKLDSDTDSCPDMAMPSVYCSYCSIGYKSIELLEEHTLECPKNDISHGDNDETIAKFIKSTRQDVKVKEIFLCHFCNQDFDVKVNLEKHLNEHLGEKIMTDILQLESDFNLQSENNFIQQYYNYFVAGYKFGVIAKNTSTNAEIQFQFYEHLLKNNKYENTERDS